MSRSPSPGRDLPSKSEELPSVKADEYQDSDVVNIVDLVQSVEDIECKPWTKSMFRLYGCLLVAYFCGCLNGYDGSLMGGLNAMSSYQDYFNM